MKSIKSYVMIISQLHLLILSDFEVKATSCKNLFLSLYMIFLYILWLFISVLKT